MFTFKRVDTLVQLEVDSNVPVQKNQFLFNWQTNDPCYAELLKDQFSKEMERRLEKIRRESYELGWKEAKSKKCAKRTWFSYWW